MFSGTCVLCPGSGCTAVVKGEKWPQTMGIRVIDSTLQWVEQDVLTVEGFVRICGALGIKSSASNRKRSLMTKLVDRRRQLVETVDESTCLVDKLVPNLRGSSSLSVVRALSAAHGLDIPDSTCKDDVTKEVFGHVTRGECTHGTGYMPGCEQMRKEMAPLYQDVIHLQLAVLWDILGIVSRKQIYKILDIHEIDYGPEETMKKLRSRLKRYIQNIEKGKLKDAEAESRMVETLHKLDEICRSWPNLIPSAVKETIIKNFRAVTSSVALATFTCACCAHGLLLRERVRRQHTEVNLDLLDGPKVHWNDSNFAPPPTPFLSGPLKGKLVDAHGIELKDGGDIVLELCNSCLRGLRRNSLPKHMLANRMYLGPIPDSLGDLTMVEESMIARV